MLLNCLPCSLQLKGHLLIYLCRADNEGNQICSETKQQRVFGLEAPLWHGGCCWKCSAGLAVLAKLLGGDGWLPLNGSQASARVSAAEEPAEHPSGALVRLSCAHNSSLLLPAGRSAELRVPGERREHKEQSATQSAAWCFRCILPCLQLLVKPGWHHNFREVQGTHPACTATSSVDTRC